MSDRLSELRRQRAQIQQHLEWLDREIAAASPAESQPTSPPSPAAALTPAVTSGTAPAPVAPTTDTAAADEIIASYGQPDPVKAARQTKRGCLLYLLVAFVIFFGTVFLILHFAYGDRPWFFVNRSEAASTSQP